MENNLLYRSLPNVNVLLEDGRFQTLIRKYGRENVKEAIHEALEQVRICISLGQTEEEIRQKISALPDRIEALVMEKCRPDMRRVINGTGTILHTNLGRAPISRKHMEQIASVVTGYSNLEYDLDAGKRGERYSHFEGLLCRLTGAQAAMAVNNNAASVLLILSALAKGGEAIVSRGELVEIGGKFRIPDVMEQSGVTLAEVGTTNKTHPEDYENAVTEETKVILKVHTSNYRIVGFTKSVEIEDLVSIGNKYSIPVVEDMGSGALVDLGKYGLFSEPMVQDAVKKGADLVCFSGDKLLGGPQAGIIVGKKKYIDILKKHPLTRAVRIDKFTAAALELVLREYISEETAAANIPVLDMLTKPLEETKKSARSLCAMLKRAKLSAEFSVCPCEAQVGGGSLPMERIPSMAVTIKPEKIRVTELEDRMRHLPVPVFGRIINQTIFLDVRTIDKNDFKLIVRQFRELDIFETAARD